MNKSGRNTREILTSAFGTPVCWGRSFGSETPFTGERSEASGGMDLVTVPSEQLAEEGPHSEPQLKGNIQGCVGDTKLNNTHQALKAHSPPALCWCLCHLNVPLICPLSQRWSSLSASTGGGLLRAFCRSGSVQKQMCHLMVKARAIRSNKAHFVKS